MPAADRRPDLAVVGAGILGLATAREWLLRRPGAEVVVLEREAEVAAHQTGHNSGVVHAGLYYAPGSLKARLCAEGARALYDYCDARGIPYERCGKVVVATEAAELPRLDALERRARANGVAGLRRLGPEALREVEPHATGVAALHSPGTGIVDFGAVARALRAEVAERGGTVRTGVAVARIAREPGGVVLATAAGPVRARRAVACAGAWSDRLARASGEGDDPRIVPFRGAYLTLRPAARPLVRGLIYPVPDPRLPFLGVHLTRTIAGEVWLGPTALLAPSRDAYGLATVRRADLGATLRWPGTWRMARRWWRTGLTELGYAARRRAFVAACARYVPALRPEDVAPGPAGVRAQAVGRDGALLDDFAFAGGDGVLHVRNAPSPAATSSLAIARVLADRLEAA